MSTAIKKKVDKQLAQYIDKPEIIGALRYLSEFYEDNSFQSRRNLTATVQSRRRDLNGHILEQFKQVYSEFSVLRDSVDGLMDECNRLSDRLQESKSQTDKLFQETQKLNEQKTRVEKREVLVEDFLARFHLSEEEDRVLTALESKRIVTPEVFKVIARIQDIRLSCRKLMEKYHQRIGLEIITNLGARRDKAYEQLYKWTQDQARNPENQTDLPLLSKSLCSLMEHTAYFDYCTQELASSKRQDTVTRFIQALKRGRPGGIRPIEANIHDPVRYISDMLAWVHEELCSVREYAIVLFNAGKEENTEHVTKFLDLVMEGISRPLSSRLHETLDRINENGASSRGLLLDRHRTILLCFRIGVNMDFYRSIFRTILGEESVFHTMMVKACEQVYESYNIRVKERVTRVDLSIKQDNRVSSDLKSFLNILSEVCHLYSSSPTRSSSSEEHFVPILNQFLDPLVHRMERQNPSLPFIFQINIILAILKTLDVYEFTKNSARFETLSLLLETLQKKCRDDEMEKLVGHITSEQEPLVRLQAFDSMFQLGVVDMNHLRQIKDREIMEKILDEMYTGLLEDYTATYMASKANGTLVTYLKPPELFSSTLSTCLKLKSVAANPAARNTSPRSDPDSPAPSSSAAQESEI